MNARFFTAATMIAFTCAALPAKAADPQLLNLVMPDAKVMAGVNVQQAKTTPFGQYVLAQIAPQDQEIQKLVALIGFDPRRDVSELLVASNPVIGAKKQSGLALARGSFDSARILAAATTHNAKTESYGGVTLIEDPEGNSAVAFPDPTLAVMGDVANVKAALDRRTKAAILPAEMMVKVSKWGFSQDAWVISTMPVSSLTPPTGAPQIPGLAGQNAFLAVQQAAAGIKFGNLVVLSVQAQTDTAQNAEAMKGVVQLLGNLAQLQAAQNPAAAALVKSLTVSSTGNVVDLSMSMSSDQFQQLVQPKPAAASPSVRRRVERRM